MQYLHDIIDDRECPSAIPLREIVIRRAVESFFPLYIELCVAAGCRPNEFSNFIKSATSEELISTAMRFLSSLGNSNKVRYLNGSGEAYNEIDARRYFLIWSTHQTQSGGYNPFITKLVAKWPRLKKLSKNEKIAVYVAKAWAQSRLLDFSWTALYGSIHLGLEGSNRNLAGRGFEASVREAVIQACEAEGMVNAHISSKEVSVQGRNGKKSRIDIVVDTGSRLIFFPCKSTQVGSSAHSTLYQRDMRDSLVSIGASPKDSLIVLGGEGWQGIVHDDAYHHIWIPDASIRDDFLIEEIRNKILETGILLS